MAKDEDTGSPGRTTSFLMQTTEDVARAVAAAAASATTTRSPRPLVVFSSKDEHGDSKLEKLQQQFLRVLNSFSSQPPEVKSGTYNPEVLTSQKRQWASFQLQHLDHRSLKEPAKLFESMVVVGLNPHCDLRVLQKQYVSKKLEGSGRLPGSLNYLSHSRVEPILEPQVLFAYPLEKQLPLKYKDLVSFCFPGGLEVHAVERTPSMSELNEILLGQEHLKQSDLSFVFRLQVADDSTLYGCCMLVEELVQKPSGLLSVISTKQPCPSLSRYVLTTRRCYCILSRLPFFELHFGVLNSIFTEERLERLTQHIGALNLESLEDYPCGNANTAVNMGCTANTESGTKNIEDEKMELSASSLKDSSGGLTDGGIHFEDQVVEEHSTSQNVASIDDESIDSEKNDLSVEGPDVSGKLEECNFDYNCTSIKQVRERHMPNPVLPLLRSCQYESSDSSSSFQGSPAEERNLRSETDDTETDEASFSGQDDSAGDYTNILDWAKTNNHGSLQIICEYYRLQCPARGSTLRFHPLEHLHPVEYCRPDETWLRVSGSTIDLRSCSTSLELAEAHSALLVEEEALALSTWAVACICGTLRLEHVLTIFAGALLEKQIVIVCSNLGILSASVLSVVPLIRPYQWQSLLMPILPDDMLDFLDAPVPYIVGVKNKTIEVQSRLTSVILVDANKNQVKSPTIPQLPNYRQLFSSLSPYHAQLVGESYLARKRPVYECTDLQIQAAKSFLMVLRSYIDSLCSNLRSHTITNVQSNNDKVSLLLKESFIDSFPSRDRPFMKLFVDTQLFSVHTDLVLSFFQKE